MSSLEPPKVLTPDLAWELATGGPWPSPDDLQEPDERYMALALREGLAGVGLSSPNPPVGCVLVRDGRILGRGGHTRAGEPHGEIVALQHAAALGESVTGATAYVTLEPCCHQGRTPPCTDALLRAGVHRVVVGVGDPNPRVSGGGLAILRAHGLEVREGVLGEACARFHAPFFKLIRTGLPWVQLKLAVGSDLSLGPAGRTTAITPPEVQALAHALRRSAEAMVAGRATVEVDDPQLTDRWPLPTLPHRTFLRVVLDGQGRLFATQRVWKPVSGQPVLRVVTGDWAPLPEVEDLRLPPGPGGCSLKHLLCELVARGVGRVLFEGGGRVAHQLMSQGLVDEFHRFRADKPAGGEPLDLDLSGWPARRACAAFPGGVWEVFAR